MGMKFVDFAKNCRFLTFSDDKCVNENSKDYRMVGGCQYNSCPLKEDFMRIGKAKKVKIPIPTKAKDDKTVK